MTKSEAIVTLKKITAYPYTSADQKYKISNLIKEIEYCCTDGSNLSKNLENKVLLANTLQL